MNYITPENTIIVALILITIGLTNIWLNKLMLHPKYQQPVKNQKPQLNTPNAKHILILQKFERGKKLTKKRKMFR